MVIIKYSKIQMKSYFACMAYLFLCTSTIVSTCPCVCMCVPVHMYVETRGWDMGPFSASFYHIFWDKVFSLDLEFTNSARLADHWASRILLSLPSRTGIIDMRHHSDRDKNSGLLHCDPVTLPSKSASQPSKKKKN